MSQQLSDASANFIFSHAPRSTRDGGSPSRVSRKNFSLHPFPPRYFLLSLFLYLSLGESRTSPLRNSFSLASLSLSFYSSCSPVLSLRLFTFIRGKLEPQRPPIIAGEIIKKAGAGEILKRRREGRPLSAGRYRSTAMLGSTSSPHTLCNSPRFLPVFVSRFFLFGAQLCLARRPKVNCPPPLSERSPKIQVARRGF